MIKDYNFNKIRVFLHNRLQAHNLAIEEGKGSTDLKEIQRSLSRVKIIKEENSLEELSKEYNLINNKNR